jgi:hypothetical protein
MLSPHPFTRLLTFAGALVLALSAGCNTGPRCPVDGKVSYAGASVDVGGIAFIPTGEGGGPQSVTGRINGGKYMLDSHGGPLPGKYRVEITWRKKTGNKEPGEGGHPRIEFVPGIPAKYNTESELVVEVKPGHNTFDFILKE